MKFAKVFQQVLEEEKIPAEWVSSAIQYKALKKCITRVVTELSEFGLEKSKLQQFLQDNSELVVYEFEKGLVPKLTVTLDNRIKGMQTFEQIAKMKSSRIKVLNDGNKLEINLRSDNEFFNMLTDEVDQLDHLKDAQESEMLKLISNLSDTITRLVDPKKASSLATHLVPMKSHSYHSDMYVWREIFRLYIESNIFFSTLETDSGEHNADMARKKLLFFAQKVMGDQHDVAQLTFRQFEETLESERLKSLPPVIEDEPRRQPLTVTMRRRSRDAGVAKHHQSTNSIQINSNSLISKFRNASSKPAFQSFWNLNNALLQALQFQTINNTAITKILKKFDKQTALNSRFTFLPLITNSEQTSSALAQYHPFISTSLAKKICFVIAERLIPITPQIDDYLCPICTSISYKPIRLDCNHVFCVRCLVHLQRSGEDRCPICRQNVVLSADETNLDSDLLEYLKTYFPKEIKKKQSETEKEIAKEQLDQLKQNGDCSIM